MKMSDFDAGKFHNTTPHYFLPEFSNSIKTEQTKKVVTFFLPYCNQEMRKIIQLHTFTFVNIILFSYFYFNFLSRSKFFWRVSFRLFISTRLSELFFSQVWPYVKVLLLASCVIHWEQCDVPWSDWGQEKESRCFHKAEKQPLCFVLTAQGADLLKV